MLNLEQPSATFIPASPLSGSQAARISHLPFAADLIAALSPTTLVELGISNGENYFGYCQTITEQVSHCLCYGIDPDPSLKANTNRAFESLLRHNNANYQSFSTLIRKPLETALAQFEDESISLLSLQSSPSYEEAKQTFISWLPKVSSRGVILLHDVSDENGPTAAWRLWTEVRSVFPSFLFRHNSGLGVLGKSQLETDKVPFLKSLFHSTKEQQELKRRYYSLCAERLELAAKLQEPNTTAEAASLFQVFRSQAGTYRTTPQSSHVLAPGSWLNLQIQLPDGTGDQPLRLNLTDQPAIIDFAHIALRKLDGQMIWSWSPKDLTKTLRVEGAAARVPSTESFRVLALSPAAQAFLPDLHGAAFQQPLHLEIRLRVDLQIAAAFDSDRLNEQAEQWEHDRHQLQTVILERDQLLAEQPRMLQEIAIAQGNVQELKAELEQLNVDHEQLQHDSLELRKANARLSAALEEERALRAKMQYSTSWKLTKPVRALGQVFAANKHH